MKKIAIAILVIFVLVGLAGCASEKESEVKVMLDWYPNAVHSFLYVALEKGYFAEEGLNIEIEMPAETNDPLKLVAAGKTTFAVSYQPQLVMARAKDIPVVSIASVVDHPLSTIMVPQESSISNPKDLEGKTVGYSLPVYEAIVKTAVQNAGGDISKVELLDIGWDLIPALATAKVDATSGGFINHEQILLEKEGHAIRAIDPVKYGVPDYYELILVANEDIISQNKELVEKFYKAVKKGQDYVAENPEESLEILLQNQNETFPLEEDVEKESLEILLPLMEDFGKQELASWESVIDWMAEMELIEKKPEAKDAFIQL